MLGVGVEAAVQLGQLVEHEAGVGDPGVDRQPQRGPANTAGSGPLISGAGCTTRPPGNSTGASKVWSTDTTT